MKNFAEQWNTLITQKDEDASETLKISKALPVIKWVETFRDHLYRCLIVKNIHISYVTCTDVGVAGVVPRQEAGQHYSTEHGFLEGYLVFRASPTHGLYCNNNAKVYHKM